MVAHAFNPTIWEADTGWSVRSSPALCLGKVRDQPGLHREYLSQNKTTIKQNTRTSDCCFMLELFMIYLLLSELGPHGSKARLGSGMLLWMTLNFEPSGLHILRAVVLGDFVLFVCFCLLFWYWNFVFWFLPLEERFRYRVILCSLC